MTTKLLPLLIGVALATPLATARADKLDDPSGEVARMNLSKADWLAQANAGCHTELNGSGMDSAPRDVARLELAIQRVLGLPCTSKPGTQTKALYLRENKAHAASDTLILLDEGYPSELLRVLAVLECLPRDASGKVITAIPAKTGAGAIALCEHDIKALDKTALEAEISTPAFDDFARARARDTFAHAKTDGDAVLAVYTAAARTNPALQKFVFALPEQAWTEWSAAAESARDALDAAHASTAKILLDVTGRTTDHPETSCAPLRAAIAAHVKASGAKTEPDALKAEGDPIGWRLYEAAAVCDGYAGNIPAWAIDLAVLRAHGGLFGPRMLAATTLLGAVSADPKSAPYTTDDLRTVGSQDWMLIGNFGARSKSVVLANDVDLALKDTKRLATAVIASAKPQPGGVLLTFKKSSIQVPDLTCGKEHLVNFDANGTPIFQADCETVGMHAQDTSQPPILMPADLGPAVKVGELLQFYSAKSSDGTMLAFPVRAWSAADAKHLVVLYGVPVDVATPGK